MKKLTSLLVTLLLALTLAQATFAYTAVEGNVSEIQKYGNIVLSIASLTDSGYEYGDILAVTIDGKTFDVPFGTNYSDVDTGELILRDNSGIFVLAINMGDFASAHGIAVKNTAEDGTVTWTVSDGRALTDIKVSITMKQEDGYRDEYLIHQLTRTNERSDYASDEIFANFRNISSGSLGANVLFRSSSPVNNELGRAAYADDFMEANHIATVVNLADTNEEIESYFATEGYDSPYYQSLYYAGQVKALGLGVDFTADDFKSGLAEGLRFIASNAGPYLVHCNEGKDRAGFVSALLACLMGASYDEVVADYMTTYENYYHIEKGSEQYTAVQRSNIDSILATIAGVAKGTDMSSVDLRSAATSYIKGIGLTDAQCDALVANLTLSYATAQVAIGGGTAPTANSSYSVAEGDSLWKIAKRFYGSGEAWTTIYAANTGTIGDANSIYVGQVIILPAA